MIRCSIILHIFESFIFYILYYLFIHTFSFTVSTTDPALQLYQEWLEDTNILFLQHVIYYSSSSFNSSFAIAKLQVYALCFSAILQSYIYLQTTCYRWL